jgi:pantothenate kinase type III
LNLLTLDFGNSKAHAALFRHDKLVASGLVSDIESWLKEFKLTFGEVAGVLSQVKSYDHELDPFLKQGLLCERIKDYWKGQKFAGMPVHYAQSLGEDRLIQAWWTFKNFKTPTLIIDAGSFLTLDVVTSEGFLGGHILPGLKLLNEDLTQGAQLKSISFESLESQLLSTQSLPHTTEDALGGVAVAYAALIQRLVMRWGIAQVLISGGDCEKIHQMLKPQFPELELHKRADLVHYSLLEWYKRNIIG